MKKESKTLEDLGKVPELLWDALEVGAQNVQNFFETNKVDRSLSPHIMRYAAKKYIEDNLWKVDGLKLKDISGNGIYLLYKNYHIRVWKFSGKALELPSPGHSHTKDDFLRQRYEQLSLSFDLGEEKLNDNLAILWDADDKYNLKNLRLSRPQKCTKEEDIKAEWSIVLDHPVISKDRLHTTPEKAPIYDLPLEFYSDKGQPISEVSDDVLPEPTQINPEPEKEENLDERTD